MSSFIKVVGDNHTIGWELGRYWGNYFASLNIRRKKHSWGNEKLHKQLYCKYRDWLTADRKELELVRNKIRLQFPDLWEEVVGQYEGLQNSDLSFAKDITLNGLLSCVLAEADEAACSTTVLFSESGYTMVHSDEYDKTSPLVAADIVLSGIDGNKPFFSISHPFQLFGSAAGINATFAVQGNSIGCTAKIRKMAQQNIPKTIISRKILEMDRPEEAANLYRTHPCSLPNHHFFRLLAIPCG